MIIQQTLSQVEIMIQRGQRPQARAILRQVLRLEPDNPAVLTLWNTLQSPPKLIHYNMLETNLSLQPAAAAAQAPKEDGQTRRTAMHKLPAMKARGLTGLPTWAVYLGGLLILAVLIYFLGPIILGILQAILAFLGSVLAAILSWLGTVFQFLLLILFFPLLLPLAMIISTALVGLFFAPLFNLTRVGIWLLQQPWWWFPVGHICGIVYVFCFMR